MNRAAVYIVSSLIVSSLLLASPVTANQQDPMQEFEDAAKGAAARIVEALKGLLLAVPQYEAPEILDNGDIIIRRKQRPEADQDKPPPRIKKTSGETIL